MLVSVYGAGYVGLVTAACLSALGHEVICVDIDEERIAQLMQGVCHFYEPQLDELLNEQLQNFRLEFTTDLTRAISKSFIHFIATGTPSLPDGSADLVQIFAVATQIATELRADSIVVIKSTVPVGTGDIVLDLVNKILRRRDSELSLDLISNPEFLREGQAVDDFLNAERVILGGEGKALDHLKQLYAPMLEKCIPILCMSRCSAELTKYAANAMLACRISFINLLSQFTEKFDANIDEVRVGISLDNRIGPHFLQAGHGYGGSCFSKDLRALIHTASVLDIDSSFFRAIEKTNDLQKNWVFINLFKHFSGKLAGLKIGIWGLAFKPDTDDLREASSLVVIKSLLACGSKLFVFDPKAISKARELLETVTTDSCITWCTCATNVLDYKLDALVLVTEWHEFKHYCLHALQNKLGEAPLFDGRNCFELSKVVAAKLAYYYSVGRPTITHPDLGVDNENYSTS